jgi:transposase
LAKYLCLQIIIEATFAPVIAKSARAHYRQHPLEFNRVLVTLSFEPGASVAPIAREHGVNANQIFSLCRLYQEGRPVVPAFAQSSGARLEIVHAHGRRLPSL